LTIYKCQTNLGYICTDSTKNTIKKNTKIMSTSNQITTLMIGRNITLSILLQQKQT